MPRQVAMYLSCVMTELSSTTSRLRRQDLDVLHARKKIEKKIEEDLFSGTHQQTAGGHQAPNDDA